MITSTFSSSISLRALRPAAVGSERVVEHDELDLAAGDLGLVGERGLHALRVRNAERRVRPRERDAEADLQVGGPAHCTANAVAMAAATAHRIGSSCTVLLVVKAGAPAGFKGTESGFDEAGGDAAASRRSWHAPSPSSRGNGFRGRLAGRYQSAPAVASSIPAIAWQTGLRPKATRPPRTDCCRRSSRNEARRRSSSLPPDVDAPAAPAERCRRLPSIIGGQRVEADRRCSTRARCRRPARRRSVRKRAGPRPSLLRATRRTGPSARRRATAHSGACRRAPARCAVSKTQALVQMRSCRVQHPTVLVEHSCANPVRFATRS